jgi:hypothetical protein
MKKTNKHKKLAEVKLVWDDGEERVLTGEQAVQWYAEINSAVYVASTQGIRPKIHPWTLEKVEDARRQSSWIPQRNRQPHSPK